jgi:hypothetical protein
MKRPPKYLCTARPVRVHRIHCQKCIVKDEPLPCTEAVIHMAKRFSASICKFFVPFARKDARLTQRRGHAARRIPGK